MLAAAMHPERFTKLIVFGAAHTWQRTEETPWQPLDEYFEDLEIPLDPLTTRRQPGTAAPEPWLRAAADRADSGILLINAWNEWPEGSMLEPEQEHGYGYVEAVKAVFDQ
mgnify:CR=1 FL=1